MEKSHVLYIFAATITTGLVILVWTNYGKFRAVNKFLTLLENNESLFDDSLQMITEPEQPIVAKCDYDINDFNDIIKSITRVLEFFQLYLDDLILDAAVGTRALQGQLQLILRSFSLPAEIRTQLKLLLTDVTDISDRIVGHFVDSTKDKNQSPEGEERLKNNLYWIENGLLWEMPEAGNWQQKDDLDPMRYIVEDDNSIKFSEVSFSDRCIGAVFENCTVPDDCFTLFLGKKHSEYLISHAMFFLLFAKKKNCFDDQQYMEKIGKLGNPNDIMASFCAKIYVESQYIAMSGYPLYYKDLLCEHVMVCALSGFTQFLQLPWLRNILTWQSKDLLGCFELPKDTASTNFEEIYEIKKESKRVKRHERVFSAGIQNCSAHFTGVALAAIGVHLRYCVESCGQSFFDAQTP